MHVYIENVKTPTIRFEVLAYDKTTKVARLRGEYGAEFDRNIGKDVLEKYGYKIVQSEKALPLGGSGSKAKTVGTIPDDNDPVVEVGKKKVKA
jgi:hypothetical protein